mmetsp:Transcript_87816/g.175684  ORF Transcript_87816/g.175684 Transcript_87816/m.175684 type:complete len:401 (-) Transcript_87816:9-1211(-)
MNYDWTKAYAPFVDDADEGGAEVKEAYEKSEANIACSHDHSSERAIYDLPLEEKVARMQKFLHRGNDFFEEGQYDRAYLQYRSLLTYYEYTFPEDDEGWKLIDGLRFTCNLNAAAASLKLPGMHQEVLQNCYEALQKEPGNIKALYRRAQALRALDRFDEARGDLQQALAVRPHDAQLREEASLLRDQVQAYKQHRKAMAERMMGQAVVGGGQAAPDSPKSANAKEGSSKEEETVEKSSGSPPSAPAARPSSSAANSRRRLLAATSNSSLALSSSTTTKGVVDDLDEPVRFDFAAVASLVSRLASEPATTHHSILIAATTSAAPAALNGGVSPVATAAAAANARIAQPQKQQRSEWVFGDLNRPGAFVRQRPRRKANQGGETGQAPPCECCPLPDASPIS